MSQQHSHRRPLDAAMARPLISPSGGVTQPADDRAAEQKATLRPLCRARLKDFTGQERETAEKDMLARLFDMPVFREATLICAYVPLPGEIDLFPVWRKASALGKRMAFPWIAEGSHLMYFREVDTYQPNALVPGPHHTRQPAESCPLLADGDFSGALIIVPGLCFDDSGIRLGYGGGYYDRFLQHLIRRGITADTVGLAFDRCQIAHLPRQSHDIPVDYVVSEGRINVTHADRTKHFL